MKNINKLGSIVAVCGLLALLLLPTSCISTSATSQVQPEMDNGSSLAVDNTRTGIADLTLYLKQLSGVLVQGEGPGATITVRGITSINLTTAPLFVVDGMPVGTSYEEIYHSVDVQQVKRVRVLKSSVETSMYGVRGANGVIEIERQVGR